MQPQKKYVKFISGSQCTERPDERTAIQSAGKSIVDKNMMQTMANMQTPKQLKSGPKFMKTAPRPKPVAVSVRSSPGLVEPPGDMLPNQENIKSKPAKRQKTKTKKKNKK